MPSVPTAPTVSPAVSSTTQMNLFRDAINFALSPPRAELRATVAQSIPNSAGTSVNFDTADVDTDVDGVGGHNPASNPSRFTARYPGWYLCSGGCVFVANATGRRIVWFKVNGVDQAGSEATTSGSAGGSTGPAIRAKLLYLTIGDYVELAAFQESGGALNTAVGSFEQPTMTVVWKSN